MVTRGEALSESIFHYGPCRILVGPRGGQTFKTEEWRRNGRTKTWSTRPSHFQVPIKYGLYGYSYLDHDNARQFHPAASCQPEVVKS